MRTPLRLAMLLLLALVAAFAAACGAQTDSSLTGTVNKLDRSALPANSEIKIDLLEAQAPGMPDVVVASRTVRAGGAQMPMNWDLGYNAADIDPTKSYFVGAQVIVDDQIQYSNAAAVPVLTNGAPTSNVEILLSPYSGEVAPEGGAALLTGTVNKLDRSAIAPNAVIEVQLLDTTLADAAATLIASQTINAEGRQLPIPYELGFDRAIIDPSRIYQVSARITVDGALQYISDTATMVLTGGAPSDGVEIMVVPTGGSVPATGGEMAPGSAMLNGTVNKLDRSAIAPNAVIEVQLLDTTLADAAATLIASQTINAEGRQLPIPYQLVFDGSLIDDTRIYQVSARITVDGQLQYISDTVTPVLTGGAPSDGVEIMVVATGSGAPATSSEGSALLAGVATFPVATNWPADSGAYLQVEIREPMLADASAVAYTSVPLAGLAFPVAFQLAYDPALIDPAKAYVLDGRIIDNNQLAFSGQGGVPVLTNGAAATDVELPLYAGVTTGPMPVGPATNVPLGGGVIDGTITTDSPVALDAAATLIIDLREAGTTGTPMVSITQMLNGAQFPLAFEVPYSTAMVDETKDYVIGARILLGDRVLYASPVGVPVLTKGAPVGGLAVNIPPQ